MKTLLVFFILLFFVTLVSSFHEVTTNLEGKELSVRIVSDHSSFSPGDSLTFQVIVKDPSNVGRKDLLLDYYVKKGDDLILKRSEIKAMETQASFFVSWSIPHDLNSGTYILEVNTFDNLSVSETFRVSSSIFSDVKTYLIILIFIMIGLGISIHFEVHKLLAKRRKCK
jgi:hypothetical protein